MGRRGVEKLRSLGIDVDLWEPLPRYVLAYENQDYYGAELMSTPSSGLRR